MRLGSFNVSLLKTIAEGSQTPTPRRFPTPINSTVSLGHLPKSEPRKAALTPRDTRVSAECQAYARLLKEKEAVCAQLTMANAQLQAAVRSQSTELERLRGLTTAYEAQLKVYFASNFEKQLAGKEALVYSLTAELAQAKVAYEREIQLLATRLGQGETQLSGLRSQLLALLKQRPKGDFPLYDTLQRLQRENQALREQLEKRREQEVTRQQFEGLEAEFRTVEEMQERVIQENGTLKRRTEEMTYSEQQLRRHVHSCHAFLIEANFHFSQMLLAVQSIREGTEVNPSALLTSKPHDSSADLDSLDALSSALHQAKSQLAALQSLLTATYTDLCSANCGVQ